MKLCIPEGALNQHIVWLGKTRAGKSSAMRHVVEWLLSKNKRVCIIDPKGDWYGLKQAGTSPGFPVVLFGDFKDNVKSDVPLIPRSQLDNDEFDTSIAAKHVAQLVSSGNRPCVIGMRGWTEANMTRFWIEFASTVFNRASGELYLVIDEIHNFAPKGKLFGNITKSLHWAKRLLNEGGGIGIVNLIASQRPQKVHNDVLTACETLCAMRVIHKADRDAITDWIKGCGDQSVTAESLALAEKPRGEAVVWSPEIKFGPESVTFPLFTTFDSFAPQRLQKKKLSERGWASVDLTEIREKLARVIEQTKAEDPEELRKTIAGQRKEILDLTRKLDAKPTVTTQTKTVAPKTQKINVVDEKHVERFSKIMQDAQDRLNQTAVSVAESIEKQLERQRAAMNDVKVLLAKVTVSEAMQLAESQQRATEIAHRASSIRATSADPAPAELRVSRSTTPRGDGELSKMERNMLIALAQHSDGLTKPQILLHASYASSGPTSRAFASLVQSEYAKMNQNKMYITPLGKIALGGFEPLPQGEALREHLLTGSKLNTMEKGLLRAACDVYPSSIAKGDILKAAQYASSGPTSKAFARLVRYGYLIPSGGKTYLRASEKLFD